MGDVIEPEFGQIMQVFSVTSDLPVNLLFNDGRAVAVAEFGIFDGDGCVRCDAASDPG